MSLTNLIEKLLIKEVRGISCITINGELYHYGVKGMKWGVRRFQNQNGTLTSAGRKRYADDKTSPNQKKKSKHRLKLEEKYQNKGMTKQEAEEAANKRIKKEKAAVAATAIIAAYATYKLADSGELNRLAAKGKSILSKNDMSFNKNSQLAKRNLDKDELKSLVVSRINPDYGKIGTKNNCRRCTMAYELSRRGYDVKATKTISGTGQDMTGLYNAMSEKELKGGKLTRAVKLAYRGIVKEDQLASDIVDNLSSAGQHGIKKIDSEDYAKTIFSALSKAPNRSRGELSMTWDSGGAHSMVWEIVNKKPVIFDCQTGEMYDTPESISKLAKHMKNAGFTRLDNIAMNEDFLSRWVKNAK
ncbi:MAG: hypothetical protein IKY27_00455 [Bacteroidales bacterium]|nr:hypothetical protein [Bacteroidales bacterium]MBR5780439.1 hypothetical protein [Bacteroidales bacterium]